MAITISGTNGIVGAGFTLDASGTSVTAGVGTFSSIGAGTSVTAAGLTGALPTISAANCTNLPAANLTGALPAISAANCTNIPAANITGTLPAISGANLTGIAGGGGGAVGAGTDKVFYENDQTVTQSYSISAGKNAMVAGPIAVASGKTITIPSGSELTIV